MKKLSLIIIISMFLIGCSEKTDDKQTKKPVTEQETETQNDEVNY